MSLWPVWRWDTWTGRLGGAQEWTPSQEVSRKVTDISEIRMKRCNFTGRKNGEVAADAAQRPAAAGHKTPFKTAFMFFDFEVWVFVFISSRFLISLCYQTTTRT